MPQLRECPSSEKFALFVENRLPPEEHKEILLHIADCNECAIAYSIVNEMLKTPVVKAKPILFALRYFSHAAAIVLLAGASFIGGIFYAHRSPSPMTDPENEYLRLVQNFESSPLYWSRLNDAVWQGQDSRILDARGSQLQPDTQSVREILAQKKEFDRRLSEIASLSDKDIDAVLSVDGLNIPAMTSSDIEVCAAFLKDGRIRELRNAERWLRFDQSAYFSLAGGSLGQLPPAVWERYPVSEESLKTLSWIAGLSEEEKEKILALSPEEARREREKEKTRSAP